MKLRISSQQWLCSLSAILIIGCSGGGGSSVQAISSKLEAEPNNSFGTAQTLSFKQAGTGNLDSAGDVDYWQVDLKEGWITSFNLRAYTLDRTAWSASGNSVRLALFDTDGTSKLLEHRDVSTPPEAGPEGFDEPEGFHTWAYHEGDIDIPAFYVPASGTYYLAVSQNNTSYAGGDYALQVKREKSFGPIATEFELPTSSTNDTAANAEPIKTGTVLGYHSTNSDFYSFEITTPSIVRFEVYAYRNGILNDNEYLDAELNLYDTDGTTSLFYLNDAFASDPYIEYLIDTPGTYYVAVDDDGSPAGRGNYLLKYARSKAPASSNESEPNNSLADAQTISYGSKVRGRTTTSDPDWFAFSGKAGDSIRLSAFDNWTSGFEDYLCIELFDEVGDDTHFEYYYDNFPMLSAILQSTGTHYIRVVADGLDTDYVFEFQRLSKSNYEVEPNDITDDAHKIKQGARWAGVIGSLGDKDRFRFSAKEGYLYEFATYSGKAGTSFLARDHSAWGSILTPRLRVLDDMDNVLSDVTRNNSTGQTAELTTNPNASANLCFVAPSTGNFTLEVSSQTSGSGDDEFYMLEYR